MRKFIRIFALVIVLSLLTACFGPSDSLRNPNDIPDRPTLKTLFVHVGHWWWYDYMYPQFTDTDFERLTEMGVNQFCISFGADVMSYRDESGELTYIVDLDDIMAICYTDRMIDAVDEAGASAVRNVFFDEFTRDTGRTRDSRISLDTMAEQAIGMARQILGVNADAQLWFMFPNAWATPLAHMFAEPFIERFYNVIKEEFYGDVWDNNILGFYMGKEEVPTIYSPFNTDNMVDFDNSVVYLMRELSRALHADGKLFFWAPFSVEAFEPGQERGRRIGYVANHTDIFDYVALQPNTLFYRNIDQNLATIRMAMEENAVVNHNGDVIGGPKTSSTTISVVIELEMIEFRGGNPRYEDWTGAESRWRFQEYVNYFRDMAGHYSLVFYAGERTSIMNPLVFERLRVFWDKDAEVPDDYVWPPED